MAERIGTASFGAMAIICIVLTGQLQPLGQPSPVTPEPEGSQVQRIPGRSGDGILPVPKQSASVLGQGDGPIGCVAGREADRPESGRAGFGTEAGALGADPAPPALPEPPSPGLGVRLACIPERPSESF